MTTVSRGMGLQINPVDITTAETEIPLDDLRRAVRVLLAAGTTVTPPDRLAPMAREIADMFGLETR